MSQGPKDPISQALKPFYSSQNPLNSSLTPKQLLLIFNLFYVLHMIVFVMEASRDNLGNLAFDVDSIEESKKSTLNKIVMIQDEGEIIFVPSGWYHQVCNLEDTISINHNWFNGCNIETVYHNLILELRSEQNE